MLFYQKFKIAFQTMVEKDETIYIYKISANQVL